MREFLVLFVLACTATAFATQIDPPSKDKSSDQNTTRAFTLTGCVVNGKAEDPLTLADSKNGTYHLSGTDLPHDVGTRMQVTGFWIAGLRIVGGLWPSPNVAAQAGAIDPARAAVAAMPGASHGIGPDPLLEFQTKQVQALKGGCP